MKIDLMRYPFTADDCINGINFGRITKSMILMNSMNYKLLVIISNGPQAVFLRIICDACDLYLHLVNMFSTVLLLTISLYSESE